MASNRMQSTDAQLERTHPTSPTSNERKETHRERESSPPSFPCRWGPSTSASPVEKKLPLWNRVCVSLVFDTNHFDGVGRDRKTKARMLARVQVRWKHGCKRRTWNIRACGEKDGWKATPDRMRKLRGLYVLTDEIGTPDDVVVERVRDALRGGARVVQYRHKGNQHEESVDVCRELAQICKENGAIFLVNDRPELARDVDADGVHVGQDDGTVQRARNVVGPGKVVGASCYGDVDRALKAVEQGADYVAFGSFFPSPTKPKSDVVPTHVIDEARQRGIKVPICAIGGLDHNSMPQMTPHVPDMYACVSAVWKGQDVVGNTKRLTMRTQEGLQEKIFQQLEQMKSKTPLVQAITNYVTINDCANILLAIGASPAMCESSDEAYGFSAISSAVYCNIGSLTKEQEHAILQASRGAKEANVPMILDPVGCAAIPRRIQYVDKVRSFGKVDVVKGNLGEIKALMGKASLVRGVDSLEEGTDGVESCKALAQDWDCVVVATGKKDIITDGETVILIDNGVELFTKITGAGCMAGALIAAFCGATTDLLVAAAAAHLCMGVAGELAFEQNKGNLPGSFRAHLMDQIYLLDENILRQHGKVEILR